MLLAEDRHKRFVGTTFSFGMPEFLERASFPDERRWQFADTVTMTAGNHTWKFGGDINFVKDIINNLRFSVVSSTTPAPTGLPDFIVDYTNFRPTARFALCRTPRSGQCSAVASVSANGHLEFFAAPVSATRVTSTRASVFWV
jgi:hypothetical protein